MEGEVDRHVCACVNPRDLFQETPQESIARSSEGLERDLITEHFRLTIEEPELSMVSKV